MRTKYKLGLALLVLVALVTATGFWLAGANIAVLEPKGLIAEQQRDLIIFASLLSLLVIIPVFVLTFYIAYTYREGNKKAEYKPTWDGSRKLEAVWWGLPILLILVLGITTWITSHSLDPFKPLDSDKKPLQVQVVALDWKWLFIYPEQGIASVNALHIPANTPINFEITADAPMNSFWIPELGGQIYAMAGMSTKLHLMANQVGAFNGSSANLSGDGFAGMKFITHATSESDFANWATQVANQPDHLSHETYTALAQPSKDVPPTYFGAIDTGLYDTVLTKYMPLHSNSDKTDKGMTQTHTMEQKY
jgi:cytochrome o ubiquinol oxidase subunit 2